MLHEVVGDYDEVVASVERLDVTERYDRVHVRARLVLVDGSELHASEVWVDEALVKYSYYWLEETGETIIGWDNAPHHDGIETAPHHKHRNDDVEPSEPMTPRRVLDTLSQKLS